MVNNISKTNYLILECEHDHTYAKKELKSKAECPKKRLIKNLKAPLRSTSKNQKHKNATSMGKNTLPNKLKFLSLNVGGFKSKMISGDFEDKLNCFDIICLLEIKMDLIGKSGSLTHSKGQISSQITISF